MPTTTALSATTTALLDTLADAIESKDSAAVAAHYAPGRDPQPARPRPPAGRPGRLRGDRRDRGVLPRHLWPQHRPPRADRVATPDRIAFTQHCRYPAASRSSASPWRRSATG